MSEVPKWLRRRTKNRGSHKVRKRRLLDHLIERQDGNCIACGEPLTMINPNTGREYYVNHKRRPTFDHVVPRAKTKKHKGNLLAAHRKCNGDKGDRDPTGCELIWLEVVNERTGHAKREMIQRGIDAWKKHLDEQEQLSYSDSQRQRIEEETSECSTGISTSPLRSRPNMIGASA